MDIKHAYRLEKRLRPLKAWYFLLLAVVFGVISLSSLRQNNFEMIKLRDAVAVADQNNGDVEKALQDLRRHVYGHMNTDLSSGPNAIKPPIQLKYRYDRLMAAEQDRVKQVNAGVTAAADVACTAQYPATGYNAQRVTCVQEYVAAHASKAGSVPDSLYKFDFVSPRWSPDLAGWSLVLSGLNILIFIVLVFLKRSLHKKL